MICFLFIFQLIKVLKKTESARRWKLEVEAFKFLVLSLQKPIKKEKQLGNYYATLGKREIKVFLTFESFFDTKMPCLTYPFALVRLTHSLRYCAARRKP